MNHRNKYRRRFWPFPFLILGAGLLLGGAVKLLWNAILPDLLGVKPIAFWQAVGLLALCRILLGNFGGRMGGPRRNWRNHRPFKTDDPDQPFTFGGPPWKNKWMKMNAEERMKFRDEIRKRCRPRENE